MRGSALVLSAILLVPAFAMGGAHAIASGTAMHICNHSAGKIAVAAGYLSSGPDDDADTLTGPFVSTGWWTLEAGECTSVTNPFSARYMYWSGFSFGTGPLWQQGDWHFCVPNVYGHSSAFTFESQNASEDSCTTSTAYGTGGANMWMAARQVDVSVDPNVDYDGT